MAPSNDAVPLWPDERVFVTGGAGFIGSWLSRDLLHKGARVLALVLDGAPRSPVFVEGVEGRAEIVQGALQDLPGLLASIRAYEPQTVFHLGAQTLVPPAFRDPLTTFESNIRGTYNLLEACRRLDGVVERVVVASSDKAYGGKEGLPYRESMALEGRGPYEVSKSCTDLLAQSYVHSFGLPVAIARCGNVFGGGDLNWSRLIPGTIRSLALGEPVILRSDGTQLRDYVYVEDIVDAYLRLARGLQAGVPPGRAFNFSYERPMSALEVVEAIRLAMDAPASSPRILDEAKGEIHDQYLDASRARKELGWVPRFDWAKGLARTLAWYRAHLGVPDVRAEA